MKTQTLLCKEVNQFDLVEYLKNLGYGPAKVNNNDYWYLSPLRDEKTPSFKVNRKLNVWYDHGIGKGGNLVDFGKFYYNCSVKEFLTRLGNETSMNFYFHPHSIELADQKKKQSDQSGKINVLSTRDIKDIGLATYLCNRQIPLEIARQYCQEVEFELYTKKHLAIGFKNNSGGYEFRNHYFKGSSTPKEPKLIVQNHSKDVAVFEGFFDFLSFQTIQQDSTKKSIHLPIKQTDFLVLNSLSFFDKNRKQMEEYDNIHLFLDRDKMGMKRTADALQWSEKYIDQSSCYKKYKDLNDYLIDFLKNEQKKSHRKGMDL